MKYFVIEIEQIESNFKNKYTNKDKRKNLFFFFWNFLKISKMGRDDIEIKRRIKRFSIRKNNHIPRNTQRK